MTAPPSRNALSDTYPLPSNATMRTGMGVFWDYATGLLGTTGNAAEARAALGVGLTSRVKGLRGNVNAATPLTKLDLSADEVLLVDSNGATIRRTVTGALTCDLGLAGSVANGRDQAAAFTASSDIRIFFIWNGTTLTTVASTAARTTGPTLPSGYTHWAYATTLRWNASSNIIPVLIRGAYVHYDIADGGVNRALSGGTATSMTAVNCSALVPTDALLVNFAFIGIATASSITTLGINIRPTGAATTGHAVLRMPTPVNGSLFDGQNNGMFPVGTGQQIDYKVSSAPMTATIDVVGYIIPNGDA